MEADSPLHLLEHDRLNMRRLVLDSGRFHLLFDDNIVCLTVDLPYHGLILCLSMDRLGASHGHLVAHRFDLDFCLGLLVFARELCGLTVRRGRLMNLSLNPGLLNLLYDCLNRGSDSVRLASLSGVLNQ